MKAESVKDFLRAQALDAELIDIGAEAELFLANLRRGLAQDGVAMHMFPSYIEVGKALPQNERVIVMDAGGTNLRVAALSFNGAREPIVEHFSLYPMPGVKAALGKTAFFDALVDYLAPVLPLSRKIGFCFSYATRMYPNRDGRPLAFSKEVKLPEVEGELIGENLRAALARRGHGEDYKVLLLNDTVAALLGGMSRAGGREASSYVGFILGTGTNTAYIERNARITKVSGLDPERSSIMNTESGTYPIARRAPIDRRIDAESRQPGDHLFEKMLSGRYKGRQLHYTLQEAVRCGLFSAGFGAALAACAEIEAKDIGAFLLRAHGAGKLASLCRDEADRRTLYALIDNLEERAARLVVANWAAILEQLDCGRDPLAPVVFTVDGSTYFKSILLKAKVEYYVKAYLEAVKGYHIVILPSENSNLVGAAIAALTNL